MKNVLSLFLTFTFLACPFAKAKSAYRDCIVAKTKASLQQNGCDFSHVTTLQAMATNQCGPTLLSELMDRPGLDMRSPDFPVAIDNLKRGGAGDMDELVAAQGRKCGVTATLDGKTLRVEKVSSPSGAQ